jgi:hypothetical protein
MECRGLGKTIQVCAEHIPSVPFDLSPMQTIALIWTLLRLYMVTPSIAGTDASHYSRPESLRGLRVNCWQNFNRLPCIVVESKHGINFYGAPRSHPKVMAPRTGKKVLLTAPRTALDYLSTYSMPACRDLQMARRMSLRIGIDWDLRPPVHRLGKDRIDVLVGDRELPLIKQFKTR